MVASKLSNFGGMVPALDTQLLPEMQAEYASNVWLKTGALDGVRSLKQIYTAAGGASIARVYRIPIAQKDKAHITASYWLEFQNADTSVVESPTGNDSYARRYWAPDALGPRYTTLARVQAAQTPLVLGVPAPSVAPSVSVSGGSGTTVSRSYAYTWVTSMGEEGPPNVSSVVTGFINGTWNITLSAPGVGDTTNRDLTKVRIYRTITSSAGVTTYFFVAEQTIATTTYADTISDTVVSANNQLQSTGWTAPPTDLKGMVSMPNGMIAGWRANELWFCEPYRPHAWPVAYVDSVDARIVGCGVVGQSVVVCTEISTYLATGITPSQMALSKVGGAEPCLSQGSIVSTPQGVYYASQNGIVLISGFSAVNLTQELMPPDQWQSLFNVPGLRMARLGSGLFAFGSISTGCFETTAFDPGRFEQGDYTGSRNGFYIEGDDPRVALSLMTSATPITSVSNDPWTGEVFIVKSGVVYEVDTSVTQRQVFKWRSKKFQTTSKRNMQAMKIYFSNPDATFNLNPVENTSQNQPALAADQYGLVRFYADDQLVFTRELRTSGQLFRLPSGYEADFFQIEIEARVIVNSVQVATSVKELASV